MVCFQNAAISDGNPTCIQAIYTILACHVSKVITFSILAKYRLDHTNSSIW